MDGLYFCVSLITNYFEHLPRIWPKSDKDAVDLLKTIPFQLVLPLQLSLFTPRPYSHLAVVVHTVIPDNKKRFVASSHAKSNCQPLCTRMQMASLPCSYDSIMGLHLE